VVAAVLTLRLTAASAQPVLLIGRDTISREALEWRLAVQHCMKDTNASTLHGLAELGSSELEFAVLRQAFGAVPPDSAIMASALRLPKVTHDSVALFCIAGLNQPKFFLEDYVRPTLVNPRLHGLFKTDTTIHRAERDSIVQIFQSLREHPDRLLQYKLDTIRIERKKEGMDSLPLVQNVLSKLDARKLWPQIVESDYDYSIVMLDFKTDSLYQALAIRCMKRPFDPWFREYVKKHIPIRFLDKQLEAEFRTAYPTLWWLPAKS
jgi:hypothetical protein